MSELRYWVHPYERDAPEQIWVWGWQASCGWQEQTWQLEDEPISTMPYVRADRIEELEAQQAKTYQALLKVTKIHDEVEVKLAKAVEALGDLADCVDDGCFCSEMQMATTMDQARATLAELKGKNDE